MKKKITVGARSATTLGIMDENQVWINLDEKVVGQPYMALKEKVAKINKGAVIELNLTEEGRYLDFEIVSNPVYGGKTFGKGKDEISNFKGVLKNAHEKFRALSIDSKLSVLQMPQGQEGWMCEAEVRCDTLLYRDEKMGDVYHTNVFKAHGEATTENVSETMKDCLPRFAETRAVSRALRLALGDWTGEGEDEEPKESGSKGEGNTQERPTHQNRLDGEK